MAGNRAFRMLPMGLLGGLLCAGLSLAQNPARPQGENKTQAQQKGTNSQETTKGPEAAATEYVRALENIKELTSNLRYADAEKAGRALLAEVEAASGPTSLRVAEVIHAMSEALLKGDRASDPECQVLLQRAVDIREEALGPEHAALSESLYDLGTLLSDAGNLAAAKPLLERAVAINEKVHGAEHAEVLRPLNVLAIIHARMGDYNRAEKAFESLLGIAEKLYGKDHYRVGKILNNLAVTRANRGDITGISPLYERALAIDEKHFGPDHAEVATDLQNLANFLSANGDISEATRHYMRALAIREKSFGSQSTAYASLLMNLAWHLANMGSYAEAIDAHQRALAIKEEKLGPEHPDTAMSLMNLGSALTRTGDYARAKPLLERAVAIAEKTFGPERHELAVALTVLGNLNRATGESETARQLYGRALAIEERTGAHTDGLFRTRHELALLLHTMGEYAEAKKYLDLSLETLVKEFGPDHPHAGFTLGLLCAILARLGNTSGAFDAALRAEEIGRSQLRLTARNDVERQALAFNTVRPTGLDEAQSLATAFSHPVGALWDSLIHSRALVLDEMAARHHSIAENKDPQIAQLSKNLASTRQRLAWLVVRGPADITMERYRGLLGHAREEKENAERALAEKSAEFRAEQTRSRIGLAEVTSALPQGAMLVAYVKYGHHDFARTQTGKPAAPVPSYSAFVLRSGEARPVLVSLGTGKEVDSLISVWREQIAQESKAAGRSSKRSEAAYRTAAAQLRRKVWDPLAVHLQGAKRVFIVPDGALNLVNFAALPSGQSGYLIESGPLIHYLAAERDLVPMETPAKNQGLLALGAPAFDEKTLFAALAPEGKRLQATASGQPASMQVFRGQRSSCAEFQSMRFEPLPASAQEAGWVVTLWQKASTTGTPETQLRSASDSKLSGAQLLSGALASEAAFKANASGKRVLHLATHGFFLGGRCESALDASKLAGEGQPTAVIGENPLLLSGLALAGANQRKSADAGEEDGILTAEEIAALNLTGVEWAVLSACDTGLGEIKAGEGVFGLRRAFQVAGARTVIMSLWPVEDEATRPWMTALYERHFLRRRDTAESVREASLQLLRQRRAKNQSTHPFYWAGFVAAGDWR